MTAHSDDKEIDRRSRLNSRMRTRFPWEDLIITLLVFLFLPADDVANKLMHPSKELDRLTVRWYLVCRGKIADLKKGIDIGGFRTSPAKVDVEL